MLRYKAIEIFTSEKARLHGKPVADAVIQYVRNLKIAARCIVTRGVAGCYENGEITTNRLELLSFNLPVRIYIVAPEAETERILGGIEPRITDAIIALHDLNVVGHHVNNVLFPHQIMVRDVMTPHPRSVTADTSLSEAARLLLSSIFTGLPVVDEKKRPIGVITQGDLLRKGGLPLRLGLLARSDQDGLASVLERLSARRVAEAMTVPALVIGEDRLLTEAVERMLTKGMKRLPVVDGSGSLSGILSRLDIFRAVMRESPDWNAFRAQKIELDHPRRVMDILRRDTHSVSPDTSVEEVIRLIHLNDIQRVAVVDAEEKLLGIISDHKLLCFLAPGQEGFQGLLDRMKRPFRRDREAPAETRASDIMETDLITIREDAIIEEAIALMTEKAIKRLPVIDEAGRFQGMISRDSLLRTGFGTYFGGEKE